MKRVKRETMIILDNESYERMKNCANCDHREVCVAVARRKATHANDYSPCEHWELVGDE